MKFAQPNKSNKTKVYQTVLFGHSTFYLSFGLFIKLYYLDPTIIIVQADELSFCLFCLIYLC